MRGRRARYAIACLFAAAVLLAAYSNHFDNGFHFDDSHVLVNNLSIRSLHNVPRFFSDPLTFTARPQNAVYRPLLTLSYAIDYAVGGGLTPRAFHRTQFGLLLLLGSLIVVLFRQLYGRSESGPWCRWVALAAATLFCIHTANTETVNYLSSRSSLVATLGVVGSFVLYLGWPAGRRWQLYLLPMLIGGLAKPLTVMFAPLLFVYLLLFEEGGSLSPTALVGSGRRAFRRACVRSAPALVAAGLLFFFLRRMDAETLAYADVDRWTYARTQPFVWLHYFRLFLLPRGLTADTDWTPLESWLDWRLAVGGLFVLALAVATVRLSREARLRPIAFGLAWFALALLPTSSLFPLSEVYNEHRLFFPFVGLCLAAGWTVLLGLGRMRPRLGLTLGLLLTVTVVAAHGVGTYRRNAVWHDAESLWLDVTLKSPRNSRGQMNYGLALMRRGDLEQALAYYERAEALAPNYSILQVNLGIVKSALGDPETAEDHFRRALRLTPDYAQGHFYFARWLTQHGRSPEALRHLQRALALSPGDVDANRLLLEIYAATGDRQALERQARSVLKLAADDPTASSYLAGGVPYVVTPPTAEGFARLAFAKMGLEEWLAAAALYREALERDPDSAGSWNDLGWTLGKAGFHASAIECFERALAIEPGLERARNNLQWARDLQSAAGES